jgi:hypothetical protein
MQVNWSLSLCVGRKRQFLRTTPGVACTQDCKMGICLNVTGNAEKELKYLFAVNEIKSRKLNFVLEGSISSEFNESFF